VDVKLFTDLVTKYKTLLLDSPEVFILVFLLGWTLAWLLARLIYQGRIETASSRVEFHKERVEHFKQRVDAAELQLLRTFTPSKLQKDDSDV